MHNEADNVYRPELDQYVEQLTKAWIEVDSGEPNRQKGEPIEPRNDEIGAQNGAKSGDKSFEFADEQQGHGREQARSSGPGYNLDDLGESGELGLQHIANPKNKNNLAYYDETY